MALNLSAGARDLLVLLASLLPEARTAARVSVGMESEAFSRQVQELSAAGLTQLTEGELSTRLTEAGEVLGRALLLAEFRHPRRTERPPPEWSAAASEFVVPLPHPEVTA